MKGKILIAGLIVLFLSAPAHAKNELMLSKENIFDAGPAIDPPGARGNCDALFYIDAGDNLENLRREFPYHYCEGMYTFTLDGPPGTTVTLFGDYGYDPKRGYLIVRKTDDQKVWVLHLEEFPNAQWAATQPSRQSGGYETFYVPAPNFRHNVSSVQWGQWWSGEAPNPGTAPAN